MMYSKMKTITGLGYSREEAAADAWKKLEADKKMSSYDILSNGEWLVKVQGKQKGIYVFPVKKYKLRLL